MNLAIRAEDVATILMDPAGGVTSVVDCLHATRRNLSQTLLEIDGTVGTLRLQPGYRLIIDRSGSRQARDVSPPLFP